MAKVIIGVLKVTIGVLYVAASVAYSYSGAAGKWWVFLGLMLIFYMCTLLAFAFIFGGLFRPKKGIATKG